MARAGEELLGPAGTIVLKPRMHSRAAYEVEQASRFRTSSSFTRWKVISIESSRWTPMR